MPKGEALMADIAGVVRIVQSDRYSDLRLLRIEHSEMVNDEYDIPEGWNIEAVDGEPVEIGAVLARLNAATITAQHNGRLRIEPATKEGYLGRVIVGHEETQSAEYELPNTSRLLAREGDHVQPGQALTEGPLNPHRILKIQGRIPCQIYLLAEVQKVYRSQGQNIHDKHFEVIIRKMMSKVQVMRPGDTIYLPGDLVDRLEIKNMNEGLLAQGKRGARFAEVLLGITKASLSTDSFLSASSFQHTIKVLAGAAIASAEDPLYGLKENVIIGKLIPAGTGFVRGRFDNEADRPATFKTEAGGMYADELSMDAGFPTE